MDMIWLCFASVLIISITSGQDIDTSHIRVFPAANQSVAGVFQVSSLNDLSQPEYAFNASEARSLCLSLGVSFATKAQVWEALSRGLETCRFGWIDEHLAVIPRVKALSNCGQNQTGLVTWRAQVTKKFDVFCFNETDAATQLRDTVTNSPVSSREDTTAAAAASAAAASHSPSSSSLQPSSSSSSPTETTDSEAEAARHAGSTQSSSGGKVVLITSTCAFLLTAIIIIAYFKLKMISTQDFDVEKQQESIETEDWTCEKTVKQNQEDSQDDERRDVDDRDCDEPE